MDSARRTFERQGTIPKLPVPDLEATCAKYIQTMKPLLSEASLRETENIVDEFLKEDGPKLQTALMEYDKTVDNYVEEFWNASYVEDLNPLPINVNPCFVLEDDPTPSRNSQIARASSLILSSVKFVSALYNEELAPDTVRGKPLCMSQFVRLFSSARVPVFKMGEDNVETSEYLHDKVVTFRNARHIVVICRGQLYYFDVLWSNWTPAVTQREIQRNLERIIDDANLKPVSQTAAQALGILTAGNRKVWAGERRRIMAQSANNRKTMEMVDAALFVVCLDKETTSNVTDIAQNVLHGRYSVDQNGVQVGSCINRWYDKLQFIITESGNAGVNFEHSPVDGHSVLRFASDVFTDTIIRFAQTISGPRVQSFIDAQGLEGPGGMTPATAAAAAAKMRRPQTRARKLEFNLDDQNLKAIRYTEAALSDLILQNETECLEFTGYGKQYIVQNSMSPDAFVQLAILSAYYHIYGELVNTYESVQTKSFLNGRTEAARSATTEAAEFIEIWNQKAASPSEKVTALRAAVKAHCKVTGEAAVGLGVDRHLFALKCLFQKQNPGKPLPKIFSSEAYQVLGENILSTSNCGNPSLRFFGFGPVSPKGFGVGYIIKDDAIHFMVTSKHRQTKRLTAALSQYLGDVQDAILAINPRAMSARELNVARVDAGDESGYGFFLGDEGFEELSSPMSPSNRPVGRSLDMPKEQQELKITNSLYT
mmetsp:Transcript_9620/g.16898  ORF Transcript_9620/g.16898 Transcript_9620/m.16898 type:complete len:710 (-) Transcript_9620:24-2153(-)